MAIGESNFDAAVRGRRWPMTTIWVARRGGVSRTRSLRGRRCTCPRGYESLSFARRTISFASERPDTRGLRPQRERDRRRRGQLLAQEKQAPRPAFGEMRDGPRGRCGDRVRTGGAYGDAGGPRVSRAGLEAILTTGARDSSPYWARTGSADPLTGAIKSRWPLSCSGTWRPLGERYSPSSPSIFCVMYHVCEIEDGRITRARTTPSASRHSAP